MTREKLTLGPSLRRDVENAVLNVAARPPDLRGPWVFDEAELQAQDEAIRKRRAALKETENE